MKSGSRINLYLWRLKDQTMKHPGRHCVICGKPGGHPLTAALKLLGVPGNYAHSDCIAQTRRAFKLAQKSYNPGVDTPKSPG
jgi:hypothetical protein